MRSLGLRDSLRAAMMLVVALAVSSVFAAAIRFFAQPQLLDAYATRFQFVPGHWFAKSIIELKRNDRNTCVVLGASNGREGFDARILERNAPGVSFLNAATTGGNNEVVDLQSVILERHDLRPRCAIVAFSTWTMFRNGSPELAAEEYVSLLDWGEVIALPSRPLLTLEGHHIAARLILPLRSYARQLNLLVRVEIHRVRAKWLGLLPVSRYESFKSELQPPDDYLYQRTPPHLMQDWEKLVARSQAFSSSSRYGGALQETAMRRSLDRLLRLTDGQVAIVITPQTPILDPASKSAKPYFDRVMRAYAGRIAMIDCTSLRDLSLFVDEGHLTAHGRAILSTEVGEVLAGGVLSGRATTTAHCTGVPIVQVALKSANSD